VKANPEWSNEDYVHLAHRFVEMEIEAHPDLAGFPFRKCKSMKLPMFTGWTRVPVIVRR
jgi:hypothetical protein